MKVNATGTAKFKEGTTGQVVEVHAQELNWEHEYTGYERQMGSELVHIAEHEVAGRTVTWRIYEYPEGVESCKETEAPGLTILNDISYSLEPEPEPE